MSTPEFSRVITLDQLRPDTETVKTLTATAEECIVLEKRFDLEKLEGLTAKITLLNGSRDKILRIRGEFEAKIVQKCVISLEELRSTITSSFETMVFEGKELIEDEDYEYDPEVEDYSPIQNGMVDMGELVSQYLSVEIDPHPRKEGASFQGEGSGGKANPFQALEALKQK